MVREVEKESSKVYQCQECGFHYREQEWASKCEAWCRLNKSCNLEIVQRAIENQPRA